MYIVALFRNNSSILTRQVKSIVFEYHVGRHFDLINQVLKNCDARYVIASERSQASSVNGNGKDNGNCKSNYP